MPTVLSSPLESLFGPEHTEFRTRVRKVTSQWTPADVDRWEADGHLPRELFLELGAAGLFRERWAAGYAKGLPHGLILAEEVGALSGGAGLGLTLHNEIFLSVLVRLARTRAQQEILEEALAGTVTGCFGSTETRGGSDIASAATVAVRTTGGWRLKGEKRYTSNAGMATHVLILCRAEELPAGKDTCLFLAPLGGDGVRIEGYYAKAGIHSCDAAQLTIDLELGPDALLGLPGTGLLYTNQALQLERISLSAQLVAAGEAALGVTAAYGRRRQMYGDRLLGLTALRQRLAEARAQLWAAEALLASVITAAMRGENVTYKTAAAKLVCARTAGFVIDECMQMIGGRGYTSNYPLERLWRDVRLARIGAGADEVMRELIASGIDQPHQQYDAWADELAASDRPGIQHHGSRS